MDIMPKLRPSFMVSFLGCIDNKQLSYKRNMAEGSKIKIDNTRFFAPVYPDVMCKPLKFNIEISKCLKFLY
jgi:hypothetical protein